MGIVIAALILWIIVGLLCDAVTVSNYKKEEKESWKRFDKKTKEDMTNMAKRQNIYYNSTCGFFERDRNFDGTSKDK